MKECLKWEQAKVLAVESGVRLSPQCPLQAVCKGDGCMMGINKPKEKENDWLEEEVNPSSLNIGS